MSATIMLHTMSIFHDFVFRKTFLFQHFNIYFSHKCFLTFDKIVTFFRILLWYHNLGTRIWSYWKLSVKACYQQLLIISVISFALEPIEVTMLISLWSIMHQIIVCSPAASFCFKSFTKNIPWLLLVSNLITFLIRTKIAFN